MQAQSLDDLLARFPDRICSALQLASFHLFILDQDAEGQNVYRLLSSSAESMSFAASSATVARMKRVRRPSPFSAAKPDAWQLLATPAELETLTTLDTQLLFPLQGRTRLIGFVSLARLHHRAFTSSELRFLQELGPQMGRGLETALLVRRLSQHAVERERTASELLFAREVQEHLLPQTLPSLPGLELAAFYQSAEQVGGDYYDAFLTASGSLCLVIADVSGKGVPAALVMAALRAALHALMQQPGLAMVQVLSQLNTLLCQSSSPSRYATLFLCFYYQKTQMLEYSNAGHNPPVLRHANGSLERLTVGGPVIGLFPQVAFETHTTPFFPGAAFVAYTDGITEAINGAGLEWSETGLHTALLNAGPLAAEPLLEQLRTSLDSFSKGTSPVDDMTLLVLTRPYANPPA